MTEIRKRIWIFESSFIAVLYGAAAVAAFSSVAYELLLATYGSFLMGSSLFQYSLVVSLMMASMGVGALLSDRVQAEPAQAFLAVELGIAAVAAVALPSLYWAHARDWFPQVWLIAYVVTLGVGIGMEIPLLNRVQGKPEGLPRILFFDYLGGFLGGLVFPLVLVPRMSLFGVAGVLAILNAGVALIFLGLLWPRLRKHRWIWIVLTVAVTILAWTAYSRGEDIRIHMEGALFGIPPKGALP